MLPSSNLDRTHRIGRKKESNRKPREVNVKFLSYNTRKRIFSNKKQLKSTAISIKENLADKRMEMLKETREKRHFTNVWTANDKILYKDMNNIKIKLYYPITRFLSPWT